MNGENTKPLVSVCIPTYKRPKLLEDAMRSVLAQSYQNLEIIIGDDSPELGNEAILREFQKSTGYVVSYFPNRPGLGQNENVQNLIQKTSGDFFLLLHDDDRLLPDAIELLISPYLKDHTLQIIFGKQQIIDADGNYEPEKTERFNREYFRDASRAGPQAAPLDAALRGQIPNNAFLVNTTLAKRVGYRPDEEVGVFCDLDFSIRLAEAIEPLQLFFLNEFVSEYRETGNAISRSRKSHEIDHPVAGLKMFQRYSGAAVPDSLLEARDVLLTRHADMAFKRLALQSRRTEAAKIFFSKYYPLQKRLSARGLYHFALLLWPSLEAIRPY